MFPDGNRIIAAAMFGAAIFAPPKKKAEDGDADSSDKPDDSEAEDYGTTIEDDVNAGADNPVAPRPTVNTVPANPGESWGQASHMQHESFCKAAGFLRRLVSTQPDLSKVNKEEAAMALAGVMKDTPVADLKPNYGLMVSIFISTVQSLK